MKLVTGVCIAMGLLTGCKTTDSRPGRIVLFDGYGSPSQMQLFGRLLIDKSHGETSSTAGAWANFKANWDTLETDEIAGATIELELAGRKVTAVTDDDGRFVATIPGANEPFAIGAAQITARVLESERPVPVANAVAFVHDDRGGVLVVSDFDDTLCDTGIKDKARVISSTMFKNALQVPMIAGADRAFTLAVEAGAVGVFYLTGSPHSLYERLALFLSHHKLPRGPILLKNIGEDPLTGGDYKVGRLRTLLKVYPNYRFVFVGDDGEHDPEVYDTIRKEAPERVLAVIIRHAPGGDNDPKRFKDMIVVDDYVKTPDILATVVKAALQAPTMVR